jgi:nucleotide-binding universal stress UspA family protein
MRAVVQAKRSREPKPLEAPSAGWLAEVRRDPIALDSSKPRIMLAARGRYQSEFAVDLARSRGAVLFVIFVRTFRVADMGPQRLPRIEDDHEAQEALGTTILLAREHGVPCVPIYVTSNDVVHEILDYTVTYGCDTLIMGESRRPLLARKIEGDVTTRIAQDLPGEIALITRSANTPHVVRPKG